jgi:hypothetical protein
MKAVRTVLARMFSVPTISCDAGARFHGAKSSIGTLLMGFDFPLLVTHAD